MIYYFSAPSNYEHELKENNASAFLLSFAVDSSHWQKFYNPKNPLIIDSGAFSAWNKGRTIDVKEYKKFCLSLPQDCIFINLDVIPKTGSSEADVEKCCMEGYENYLYLKEDIKNIMPVYHYKDKLHWLSKYSETSSYIGISPANDTHENIKQAFLDDVFRYINPAIKTHALGYTPALGMRKYPFYSVDSISYKSADMFGNIIIYKKSLLDFKTMDLWEWNKELRLGFDSRKNRELAKKGVEYNINSILSFMKDITEIHSKKDFSYLKAQKTLF